MSSTILSPAPNASAPRLLTSRRVRQTPFSPRVEALGVKGYTVYNRMLLASVFRSLEEDYRHLKTHVQIWDVGCERQVELRGPDAARLVQFMTPRDLSRAVVGQCLYAPLIDRAGGMINDPVILKLAEDRFWLSIADSDVSLWASGLAQGKGFDAEVGEAAVWPLAVQGPKAEDLMARVFGEEVRAIKFFRFLELPFQGHPLVVARSGWSKQGGFEIYLDRADLGLTLWDALWQAGEDLYVGPGCPNLIERIEAGLLSYGNDMTLEHNPLECGLDRFCALDKPIDCLGLDALRRIKDLGIQRRICGLKLDIPAFEPCYEPWPVSSGGAAIGQVSSAAFSPDLDAMISIAMLDRGHWDPGCRVEVETPGGQRGATVHALPFI